MNSGIYTIRNKVNGKIYVGQSTNVEERLKRHSYELFTNRHENPLLQNAVNKYGLENFLFELLVECEEEFLFSEEHYWCNLLNVHDRSFGYNIRPTQPDGISRLSSETKKKVTELLRNKTKEHIRKIQDSKEKSGFFKKISKVVVQLDLSGNEIGIFKSIREAERVTKTHRAQISRVCRDKELTANNFKWIYKNQLDG